MVSPPMELRPARTKRAFVVRLRPIVIDGLEYRIHNGRLRFPPDARKGEIGVATKIEQRLQLAIVAAVFVASAIIQSPISVNESEMRFPVGPL